MATEIKMPQLSDTMSSGKIIVWKKKEGDKVGRGDCLAEVETDKANLEIECFHPGVLLKIVIKEGESAAVGQAIAIIGQADEKAPAASLTALPSGSTAQHPRAAQKVEISAQLPESLTLVADSASIERGAAEGSSGNTESPERLKISPLAKKIAKDKNLDLASMRGSGPGGRIIKKDLEQAEPAPASASGNIVPAARPAAINSSPVSISPAGTGSSKPFSKMRETIAKRMQESVTTSPHFFVTTSIDMGQSSRLRELLKERPEYKGISVNHLIIKAAAYALRREPGINSAVKDGQLYTPASINIGIVTAIPDGLLIPVIKDADKLSLKDIVFEARSAIERAKAGRPSSADLSGGTFSISNMGMFDVENFTAIINPGQGAILAISSTKDTAVVENGAITIAKQMKVTLSSDHRIIDGIMAANFLKHFKQALEYPALSGLE